MWMAKLPPMLRVPKGCTANIIIPVVLAENAELTLEVPRDKFRLDYIFGRHYAPATVTTKWVNLGNTSYQAQTLPIVHNVPCQGTINVQLIAQGDDDIQVVCACSECVLKFSGVVSDGKWLNDFQLGVDHGLAGSYEKNVGLAGKAYVQYGGHVDGLNSHPLISCVDTRIVTENRARVYLGIFPSEYLLAHIEHAWADLFRRTMVATKNFSDEVKKVRGY